MPGRPGAMAGALAVAALLTMLDTAAAPRAARAGCPDKPVPALSPNAPADVCIPDGFTDIALDYFDDFSWRAFAALVWPAAPGQRGVPASKGVAEPGPRVFETYKPLWEIFHSDASAPVTSFNAYDRRQSNPCGVAPVFGDMTIGSASGIDDIGQAGIGVLDPPLVAQNGKYVRTLTLFNKIAFDFIVSKRLFARDALPMVPTPRPDRPVIEFPIGSVAVKSAWIDVDGLPPTLAARFYKRTAMVKNAAGTGCTRATVGLIGMHIATKTASRPQWIWSSFEQKDAVPPPWADWPGAFTLNNGKNDAMPVRNPLALVPLAPEPVAPFNVARAADAPILTRTELTSYGYQHLFADTPWRFYRLVVTQWPRLEGQQTDPISPTVDGSIANSFPGVGAFSAFANITMETFDQKGVQLGCMSCHNRTRMQSDFMWTVFDHAYPSRLTPAGAAIAPER